MNNMGLCETDGSVQERARRIFGNRGSLETPLTDLLTEMPTDHAMEVDRKLWQALQNLCEQERRDGGPVPQAAPCRASTAGAGISGLESWNSQRFHFFRVLASAPRSGGQIELYMDRMTGASVVGKRVPRSRMRESPQAFRAAFPDELEDPWQEFAVTQELGRPGPDGVSSVCQCHGAFCALNGDGLLVSDYLPSGDLFDVASRWLEPGWQREAKAMPVVESLIQAAFDLHARGVAHCDISLENTLLQRDSTTSVALVDFGMAVVGEDTLRARGVRGKPSYQAPEMHAAPEMHTSRSYDARAADLFACGVAAYALAVGGYPWASTRPNGCLAFKYAQKKGMQAFLEKRKVTIDGVRRPLTELLSPRYQELLDILLDFHCPQRRFYIKGGREAIMGG